MGLGPNLASRVLDVSDTGVRLIVTTSLEPSTDVEVTFEGNGLKGIVKRFGNVRWQIKMESGEFCVGIEFHKSLDHRDWQNIIVPN